MGERRALFLDRDGVVNKAYVREGKSYPPERLDQLVFLEGVKDALILSKKLGFLNIIVTNQPDVGMGKQTLETVREMHDEIKKSLTIDDIFVCLHADFEGCSCRKPLPGMLISAAQKWQINLRKSALVGDRWRDIGAAQAVGCESFFIDYGYDEPKPALPYETVSSLREAVQRISEMTTLT